MGGREDLVVKRKVGDKNLEREQVEGWCSDGWHLFMGG